MAAIIVRDRSATGGWVHIQKLLLPLFENVCEESTEAIVVRLSEEFKLDPSSGIYLKPEVVSNLQDFKTTKGLLAKGEIFTEYNPEHLDELKVIYELLFYARDFDTFYKAACWARQNVNCGLFVDAIYLAILNRRDTEKVSIPAPYEILPNYFVRKYFVIKASSLVAGETVSLTDSVRNEGNAYILDVNYTTSFNEDTDDKLAYFHEDVGLNSYYFLTKLNHLPWLNDSSRKNYGLYMYHMMKQMMARYNLERYSNGFPELESIDWSDIGKSDYDPMLIYSNANEFSQRISTNTGKNEILTSLTNIEGNLQAVVVHMRDVGYSKSDIVNQLMDILVTSQRSYMNLALEYLSEDGLVSGYPSVLEHYMTSVRDPLFWKLNKKIVDLIDHVLKVLPSYSRTELYFPGVEVQNIEVKKMMTTFDSFTFDVTRALKTEGEDSKFEVKISQPRLNHKPFSFKISVSSLVAQKALVKIYIGPKVMPGQLVENKNLFMLLDNFEVNLKIGSNLLSRTSNEMTNLSEDLVSLESLHKLVLDAEFGVNALPSKSVWSQTRFPSRLILPKGTSEGLPLHVFVFIAPYMKATIGGSRTNLDLNTEAIFSPGYPLDLNTEIQQLFDLPNAMVKDISIIHKSESPSYNKPAYNYNANSRTWPTEDQELDVPSGPIYLSSRPKFTKKTFDYKSKNNQYGKKTDYTSKRDDYNYQSKKSSEDNFVAEGDKTNFNTDTINYNTDSKLWLTEDKESDIPRVLYLSSRPEFTKKTFDYKSKNNQYGTKTGYTAKRSDYNYQNRISEEDKFVTEGDKRNIIIDTTDNHDTDSNLWLTDNKVSRAPRTLYLSSRPEFTKRTFDYKSKNNQFGKKFDYTAKRGDYDYQSKKAEKEKFEDKEEQTKVRSEPEKVAIVNNVYIQSDTDDDNEKVFHKVVLDKGVIESENFGSKYKDFDKLIDVKTHEIKDKTEPMDVVSNIYINHDLDHEVPVIDEDKKVLNMFLYDKDLIDKFVLDTKPENDDFEKVIEIKNSNVKPHGLLAMPKRKNVYNVFVKPLKKIFDPKEILYE